jgi:hypothetical protein
MKALLVVAVLMLIQSCTHTSTSQFDFIFKFGVGSKNELNTFDSIFMKDMVIDPPVTIPLKLTVAEKQSIYNELRKIHFTELPDSNFGCNSFFPQESYRLLVQMDGQKKQLSWLGNGGPDKSTYAVLGELDSLIIAIIHNRNEFKHSPRERGGYL